MRHLSVCNAVADLDLPRLAAFAIIGEIAPGQTLLDEGEPATDFFNVTAGTLKLFKLLPDGRRQITGFARIGHFLGLAVSNTYAFSAEAIEPVRVCRFSRPKLRKVLVDFPQLEARLLEVAANELVAAQEQMLLLGRKTARERVASFLMAEASQVAICGRAEGRVHLPMTRSDIADYLGLTIETVSRTLTGLKNSGLIGLPHPGEVVILDRPKLESLAGGLN